MMLIVEILILCIGLTVFMMQHRLRQKMSVVASKLVYWTSLLFMSLAFNSILFTAYPNYYNLVGYLNIESLSLIGGLLVGYIVLQTIAPSRHLERLLKKFKKTKKNQSDEEIETTNQVKIEKDSYLKELHFETFLETVCWLAFSFVLALEGYTTLIGKMGEDTVLYVGLQEIGCLLMMVTIPIMMRQIIFYLYRIRSMKEEENLTEVEIKFHHKLKRENTRL